MTITRTSPTAKKIYLTRHAQAEHKCAESLVTDMRFTS
jgi:hypothetical protein